MAEVWEYYTTGYGNGIIYAIIGRLKINSTPSTSSHYNWD